jgi:hypothetical protein
MAWREVSRALKENKFSPRVLFPAKPSFTIDIRIKFSMRNRN